MKAVTPAGDEQPSQMGQAHAAIHDPPMITRKPGELGRQLTGVATADCAPEAPDIENVSTGIGKRVPVAAVVHETVSRGRDRLKALFADDMPSGLGSGVVGMGVRDGAGNAFGSIVVDFPQTPDGAFQAGELAD